MIQIYNAPQHLLTPAVQDATLAAMTHMCMQEGWLDSKGTPTPHDGGVWFQDNEMAFVQYVADEGSVVYASNGPILRKLANKFGYKKSANLKAAILECTGNDLLKASLNGSEQTLSVTDYGWETLKRWEWYKENDV